MDEYLIAGKLDLLPKAKNIPIGKHNINANAETIKVSDNPPQAPVSTYFNPKSPPDISFNPMIGYMNNRNINKYFLYLGETKKEAPTKANNIIKAEFIRHCSVSGYMP